MKRNKTIFLNKMITREFLEDCIVCQKLTYEDIARKIGCSAATICQRAQKLGISRLDKYENLVGKEFGKLIVIEKITTDNKVNWKCRCECNREIILRECDLVRKDQRRSRKSCGECMPRGQAGWKANQKFNGYEEITGRFWRTLINAAKTRNYEVSITKEYIYELFLKQNRRCALTNIELTLAKTHYEFLHGCQTASLDRIDSTKGYIPGNVQWIYKDLQRVKGALDENYFKLLCHLVVENDRKSVV